MCLIFLICIFKSLWRDAFSTFIAHFSLWKFLPLRKHCRQKSCASNIHSVSNALGCALSEWGRESCLQDSIREVLYDSSVEIQDGVTPLLWVKRGWRACWHSPVSFTVYFYQLLTCSHVGSLHSMGLSNMQVLCVCLSQELTKCKVIWTVGAWCQNGICDC